MLQKTAIHHGLEHPVQVELNAADLLFRSSPSGDTDDHSVIDKFLDPVEIRSFNDIRVHLFDLGEFFVKELPDLFNRYRDRQVELDRADGGLLAVIDDAPDLMIADDLDFIGAARNLRGADPDLFHFSLKISDPDDITDIVIPLKDNAQAGQDVRHNIFGAKRYGQRQRRPIEARSVVVSTPRKTERDRLHR